MRSRPRAGWGQTPGNQTPAPRSLQGVFPPRNALRDTHGLCCPFRVADHPSPRSPPACPNDATARRNRATPPRRRGSPRGRASHLRMTQSRSATRPPKPRSTSGSGQKPGRASSRSRAVVLDSSSGASTAARARIFGHASRSGRSDTSANQSAHGATGCGPSAATAASRAGPRAGSRRVETSRRRSRCGVADARRQSRTRSASAPSACSLLASSGESERMASSSCAIAAGDAPASSRCKASRGNVAASAAR